MPIIIKHSLLSKTIDLLDYYWTYRDKTPIDYDKEHKNIIHALNALKALRKKHGSIADRLTDAIKESNVSITHLSEICNIPNSTLTGWLKGSIPSDFDAVERLCSELDIDFEYLLTGKETT